MIARLPKTVISAILISSILCSFGFGKSFAWNVSSSYQQVETSVNPDQDNFSTVIADDLSDPLSFPVPFTPAEECDPEEEKEDIKKKPFQGYYSNGEQLKYHVNAPPPRAVSLSICNLYHSPLYILFEVFRL